MTIKTSSWFEVNHEGLGKLLSRRGKEFIVFELIQNAWDEDTGEVEVSLVKSGRMATLVVRDDSPEGFSDLRDAYTLFAESKKKMDAEKRGRFNLGEKLVLAIARQATIATTKGTVTFDADGRTVSNECTSAGSVVTLTLPLSQPDYERICEAVRDLIPPDDVRTTFNGEVLMRRQAVAVFNESLPTELADAEGYLRKTRRRTDICLYDPRDGEVAKIYEMGIPVVETGDKYHVDVHQKVPLNTDRDNVTPAYLRMIRTLVVNEMSDRLSAEEVASTWVKEACKDDRIESEVMQTVVAKRFGDNSVSFDLRDKEANRIATSEGRHVIHGRSLSKEEWANLRRANEARPEHAVGAAAGKVTPSAKPYTAEGVPIVFVKEWNSDHRKFASLAKHLAVVCLGREITVRFADDPKWTFNGTYGGSELTINCASVRIADGASVGNLDLLIHEFAHQYGSHLTSEFDDALSRIGAKMVRYSLSHPDAFADTEESSSDIPAK